MVVKYCHHRCVLLGRYRPHHLKPQGSVIPWEELWKAPRFAAGPFPRNFYSDNPNRGTKRPFALVERGPLSIWLTFKQAQALKGNVRKDEHGTPIVFYKQHPECTKKDEECTGEDERVPFVLCHYTAFNVEQCDGRTLSEIGRSTTAPEIDENELGESIVTRWEIRRSRISIGRRSGKSSRG